MKMQSFRLLCTFILAVLLIACANAYDGPATLPSNRTDFATETASSRLGSNAPSEFGFFGSAVDAYQNLAVIGEWGNSVNGRNAGAAYVYAREANGWVPNAVLMPSDPESGARFGHSVAIGSNTILVGSVFGGSAGYRAGSVYVFEHIDGVWTQTDKLMPPHGSEELYFGSAVGIFGATAVVGASGPLGRRAFIYQKGETGWTVSAELHPRDPQVGRHFGDAVAIWGDTAVVGSWPSIEGGDSNDTIPFGAVYVYEQVDGSWMERTILTGDRSGEEQQFGFSVDIDHGLIAIGAPGQRESAYIYERGDTGWAFQTELVVATGQTQHFGVSVALKDTTLIVGSPGANDHAGAAYVFERVDGAWQSRLQLVAPSEPSGLQLGTAVAIGEDTILLGATGDNVGGTAAGAAYSYR